MSGPTGFLLCLLACCLLHNAASADVVLHYPDHAASLVCSLSCRSQRNREKIREMVSTQNNTIRSWARFASINSTNGALHKERKL
jgi:hypothetical protein